MSFRGRGGRGGGGGNSYTAGLPFGLGYSDITSVKTTELPSIPLPVNNPVTPRERQIAVTYINFNNSVKNGPFYTGDGTISIKQQNAAKESTTSEDGIERYSDRYLKKRKIGISIDDHPFYLPLFPKELYSVMGINKKKLLKLNKFDNRADDLFTGIVNDESESLSMLEKLKELAEDIGGDDATGETNKEKSGANNPTAAGENGVSDGDDDYDEDEDDDDGDDDYNAEKYFDGGEDDYGGEGDYDDEPAF